MYNSLLLIILVVILIFVMTLLISFNIEYYKTLRVSPCFQSEIILTLFFTLSFIFFTIGVFLNYENIPVLLPLFFFILIIEFAYLLCLGDRMFKRSEIIACVISLLVIFEFTIVFLNKNYDLAVLTTPFLVFSLLQIGLSSDLCFHNIDRFEM